MNERPGAADVGPQIIEGTEQEDEVVAHRRGAAEMLDPSLQRLLDGLLGMKPEHLDGEDMTVCHGLCRG